MGRTVLGRSAELARLDRLVTAVAAGSGGLCWLQGEPGIGKSALTEAALARAATRGCTVLRAAATAPKVVAVTGSAPALQLMARCLEVSDESPDPARVAIAGLLRGADIDDSVVLTASLRLLELVERLCEDGPVVLAAEDLQWADEASLLVWNQLARVTGRLPLLLIASARATPRRDTVARLRELAVQRDGTVLDLRPLDSDAVTELAARAVGAPPGPRLARLLAGAGGNPGYLAGLLSAVVGDVAVHEGAAELGRDIQAVPDVVAGAVEVRLRSLPGDAWDALRVAAFLGPEFGATEWATAAGRSVVQVAGMIETVTADGLIDGVGDRLRFRHEIVRQLLIGQVAPAGQPELHAGIARNLARGGHDARTVARQLWAVPDPLPDWAVDWLAGLSEPTLAFALASPADASGAGLGDLLGRGLAAAGNGDRRWEALACRLVRARAWAGRDEEILGVAEQLVARTADPALAAEMRIAVIRAAGRTGQLARGRAAVMGAGGGGGRAAGAGTRHDGLAPVRWQARLAAWSAQWLHADGQLAEGAVMARTSLARARESGDPLAIASAHYAVAVCGEARARAEHLRDARDALRGRDPDSAELRLILLAARIGQAADQGDPGALEDALREAWPLTAGAPDPAVGIHARQDVLAAAACAGYRCGRWDDALAYVGAIGREDHPAARGVEALIALRRGDHGQADAALARLGSADLPGSRRGGPEGPSRPVHQVTEAWALRAEMDGDLGLAVDLMSAWLGAQTGLGPHERHDDVLPYLVRMAKAGGQAEVARAAADLSRDDAAADPSAGRCAAARLCQALIDDDTAALVELAAVYEDYGWRPMGAFVLEEAAVRLAAAGQAVRAREALTAAVRGYAALGATADIRRADTRLRDYGVRRGSRSLRRGPATGWEALTPAERRIADLAGQGLSNADIAARLHLSRSTVGNHLTKVLAKLGLRSRLEIVRAVTNREQGSQQAVSQRERHGVRTVAHLHPGQHLMDDVLDRALGVAQPDGDLGGPEAVG